MTVVQFTRKSCPETGSGVCREKINLRDREVEKYTDAEIN